MAGCCALLFPSSTLHRSTNLFCFHVSLPTTSTSLPIHVYPTRPIPVSLLSSLSLTSPRPPLPETRRGFSSFPLFSRRRSLPSLGPSSLSFSHLVLFILLTILLPAPPSLFFHLFSCRSCRSLRSQPRPRFSTLYLRLVLSGRSSSLADYRLPKTYPSLTSLPHS